MIEVVGRLVEHQKVRGLRQRLRQHQAAALAARQRMHGRARLLGREQKVLHVADDMLGRAADRHRVAGPPVSASCDGGVRVEPLAALVERRDLEVGAEADRAAVRRLARRSAD